MDAAYGMRFSNRKFNKEFLNVLPSLDLKNIDYKICNTNIL